MDLIVSANDVRVDMSLFYRNESFWLLL